MSLVEAVEKGRKLAVKDVKGAYLNASAGISKKYIIIQKDTADTLCKLKPEWEKFRDDGGRLYCLKKKALYGSKDASELWYKDSSGTLKGLGFVANPYDWDLLLIRMTHVCLTFRIRKLGII